MWSAHLAQYYTGASLVQLGDAGAGVVPSSWLNSTFNTWNVSNTEVLPYWVGGLGLTQEEMLGVNLTYIYTKIALAYPNAIFSQFNYQNDSTQAFYYKLQGGEGGLSAWSAALNSSLAAIHAATTNFYTYTDAGAGHCTTSFGAASFNTLSVDGVTFSGWLGSLLSGASLQNVG